MAYVTQQIIKTTEGWAAFDALGKPVPKDYWLFERVTEGENNYYKFKISDGVHLFAELPYQLLNGNSARISTDGYWEIFNDATQQYVKTDVKALGSDGKSAFEVWQSQPGNADKTVEQYLASLKGDPFVYSDFTPEQLADLEGKSAYQIWLAQPGNEGKTVEEFIASLKGNTGAPFTYDMFTPEQLEGLKGQDGVISVDAPADGKTYGRKNEGWTEVKGGTYLDVSPLFDAEGNPVATVSDEFYTNLQKAYTEKCSTGVMDGMSFPVSIREGSGEGDYKVILYYFDTSGGLRPSENNDLAMTLYIIEIEGSTKALRFGMSIIGLRVVDDGTKALMDNGQYKKVVILDPVSATSLTDLPITNYGIKVTLTDASALSFASTPAEGDEFMIDILNSGTADIVQPLPNASGWQCEDTSVTIAAGKVASISVRYIHGTYVVIAKGQ